MTVQRKLQTRVPFGSGDISAKGTGLESPLNLLFQTMVGALRSAASLGGLTLPSNFEAVARSALARVPKGANDFSPFAQGGSNHMWDIVNLLVNKFNSLNDALLAAGTTRDINGLSILTAFPQRNSLGALPGELDLPGIGGLVNHAYDVLGLINQILNNLISQVGACPSLAGLTVPFSAGYSFRRLIPSYTGNCVRIRRASDNAERTFGFVGNYVDQAGIAAFLGSSDGHVRTYFDQSGNGYNMIQTDPTEQPFYMVDSNGYSYTLHNGWVERTAGIASSYPYSVYSVASTQAVASRGGVWSTGTEASTRFISQEWQTNFKLRTEIAHQGGLAPIVVFAETPDPVLDNNPHLLKSDFNSDTLREVRVDGANFGSDTQTRVFPPTMNIAYIGRVANVSGNLSGGRVYELLEFSATLSLDDANLVGNSQGCFYDVSYQDITP